MKKLTFLKSLLLGVLMTVSANMYALSAGDIAIIAVNTDSTKAFTFVALADIPANTVISFTDNAWNATTQAWRTGEGTIQWSHTANVTAGTVITLTVNSSPYSATIGTVTTNTNFNLSASGDQILAYQGTTAPTTNDDANWLFAFSTEKFAWGNNSNTSDVPTALTGASVAMTASTTETDNAYFANGSTAQSSVTVSGTKSELLALFTDPSKYYKDDAGPLTIPTYIITVNTSATPAPTITVTEVTIPTFSTNVGSPATNTIHVAGTNLTEDIVLEISGTNADQFSVYPISLTPSEGTVAETDVTITYTPTSAGTHTATLTLSSTGATDVTRSLSGTAGLAAPVATEATSAGKTSFIANWEPVTGAEEYEISVYTKTQGTTTASELFISEYGEGSSGNKKYVEIFNGTGDDVDLSNYVIKKAVNGGGWSGVYNFPASTVLTNGSTFVLANNSTDVIGATAYDGTFCSWNGNDAIGLFKDDVLIDIFGVPDSDPDTGWSVAGITDATKDHILIRKPSITSPTTDWAASAGTTADDSQWIVSDFDYNATDQTTNLGSHTMDGFGTTLHPIAGSPFTVSGTETSKVITGLSPATTYYYKVVAISGSVRSAASNEIAASTLSVGVPSMTLRNIYVRDGKIYVNASAAGQRIEVYNTVGQRLVNVASKEGENEISVPAKGILLVKAGSQVTKVMVP